MARKDRLAAFIRQIWSEGRVDAVDTFLAETYVVEHDPGDPWDGRRLTRQGFKDRLTESRAAAPDQVFTPVSMIEEGDRIAVAWTWTGTHAGDLSGLPATGRTIVMSGLTVYRFDGDDRLVGHWQVADRLGVWRQIQAALAAASTGCEPPGDGAVEQAEP